MITGAFVEVCFGRHLRQANENDLGQPNFLAKADPATLACQEDQ
jgi:hypothetical protein